MLNNIFLTLAIIRMNVYGSVVRLVTKVMSSSYR